MAYHCITLIYEKGKDSGKQGSHPGCGGREQIRTQKQDQRQRARAALKDGAEAGFSREHMY